MSPLFLEITVVLCLTALLAIVFRLLRQPPMLAYLLTGILIGPLALFKIQNLDILKNFSELGITLLLFLLGLELQLKDLRSVGKIAVIAGGAQIFLTGFFGFILSLLFHFDIISSFYLSLAVTFSSTILVIKLLADKKDLHSLYGKLSIGVLLVQDFFAILLLILLSGYKPVTNPIEVLQYFVIVLAKGVIIFTIIINLARYVLPSLIHKIARSQETLFIFSLAWVFGISALIASPYVGFSLEIGGFLAGIALANASENFQIAGKIRPLRDFFITIFFVFLGIEMGVGNIVQVLLPAFVLSLFVLLFKPAILMFIMGFLGYRKRTAFFTSMTIAQVSEFSLIIVVLGNKLGQISNQIVTLTTLTVILTFIFSTYFIMHSNDMYKKVWKLLSIFELRKGQGEIIGKDGEFNNHILLIGGRRMADTILDTLKSTDEHVVVVDFDPDVVKRLQEKNVDVIFGDIIDPEIQENSHVENAKLIISTLSDLEDNLALMKAARHVNKKAKIIVLAYDIDEANILYHQGADYVVLPHLAGGRQIARALKSDELEKLEELREKDKEYLNH